MKPLLGRCGFQHLIRSQKNMPLRIVTTGDQGRRQLQGISRSKAMDPDQTFRHFSQYITGFNFDPGIGQYLETGANLLPLIRLNFIPAQSATKR